LSSEHGDFKNLFRDFEHALAALKNGGSPAGRLRWIQRMKEDGAYLVCLLRSHLWMEGKQVYGVVNRELKPIEQKRLTRRLLAQAKRSRLP
jgi:hemerythrin-like domain-containing protein